MKLSVLCIISFFLLLEFTGAAFPLPVPSAPTWPAGKTCRVEGYGEIGLYANNWGSFSSLKYFEPRPSQNIIAMDRSQAYELGTAINDDGHIMRTGDNAYNQLDIPYDLGNVTQIALDRDHAVVLLGNDTVVGYGRDTAGEISDIPRNGGPVKQIAVGQLFTTILYMNNTLFCVGEDGGPYNVCAIPSGLGVITSIQSSGRRTCALLANETVQCWGESAGILTNFTNVKKLSLSLTRWAVVFNNGSLYISNSGLYPDITDFVDVSIGTYMNLGIRADGSVISWGCEADVNVRPDYNATFPVVTNAIAVSSGKNGGYILLENHTMISVQCDYDEFFASHMPFNYDHAVAVDAGYKISAIITTEDNLFVHGYNGGSSGPVSNGAALAPSVDNVVKTSLGTYDFPHSLVLTANGSVYAWGSNTHGQSSIPPGLPPAIDICAGTYHSTILLNNGSIVMVRTIMEGEESFIPVGLKDIIAIACGYEVTICLFENGTIYLLFITPWGPPPSNEGLRTNMPANIVDVASISTSFSSMTTILLLFTNGSVIAWDENGVIAVPANLPRVIKAVAARTSPFFMFILENHQLVVSIYDQASMPPEAAFSASDNFSTNVYDVAGGYSQLLTLVCEDEITTTTETSITTSTTTPFPTASCASEQAVVVAQCIGECTTGVILNRACVYDCLLALIDAWETLCGANGSVIPGCLSGCPGCYELCCRYDCYFRDTLDPYRPPTPLSAGAIVGIVFGSIGGVIVIGVLIGIVAYFSGGQGGNNEERRKLM
jgi:alpha-tubulin suppressor-like RCC1 family protein